MQPTEPETLEAQSEAPAPEKIIPIEQIVRWGNYAAGALAVVFVVYFFALRPSSGSAENKSAKPKCAFDWLLWACGSDQTFEKGIHNALERSQREFEKQNPDMFKSKFETIADMKFEPIKLGPAFEFTPGSHPAE